MIRFLLKNPTLLKKEVALKGYNYRALAEKIEVSPSYISQIINGKKTPSALIAKRISVLLEKDTEELFSLISTDKLQKK